MTTNKLEKHPERLIGRSDLLTADEVADLLGVSRQTLYRWARLQKGPPRIKVGRCCLYRRERLFDWILAHEEQAP